MINEKKIKKYLELEEKVIEKKITKKKAGLKLGFSGSRPDQRLRYWVQKNIDDINYLRYEALKEIDYIQHEVAVLATMSSGKSTVINALLGEDLLPNQNEACTAKIFKIIDNDKLKEYKVNALYKKGQNRKINVIDLVALNNDNEVKEIIIEGDFKGIKNKQVDNILHQISLVDTPGPNNSLDSSHQEIAYELMKNKNTDYLLYVLNATQIGINDDKRILIDILDYQNKFNKNINVLFILNKIDQIDIEKEDIFEIISNTERYLKNIGFEEPKIIPISAYASKIFKFGLEGKLKTRREKNDFHFYYDLFERLKLSDLKPKRKKRLKRYL